MEHDLPVGGVEYADVSRLVRDGEGKQIEWKSSFRLDRETKEVNKQLTKAVAKTIAGFLNTSGGDLLLGVDDEGVVVGIEEDMATLSKPNGDGYELALRTAISKFLGSEIGPHISTSITTLDARLVARVSCPSVPSPVFFHDGDERVFYVRDGNRTIPLDVRAAHDYISSHFPAGPAISPAEIREVVLQTLQEDAVVQALHGRLGTAPPLIGDSEVLPPWITVGTRRVVDLFLGALAGSQGWRKIYLISPWISDFHSSASLSYSQFISRIENDRTTIYVVTRPPIDEWHSRAVDMLRASGRANIALVPDLHVKLYTAQTAVGSFALLASANFTQKSFTNREIGMLINEYSEGRRVISELSYEAAQLYRTPSRRLLCKAQF